VGVIGMEVEGGGRERGREEGREGGREGEADKRDCIVY
jgi:hypothetical protein